MPFGDVNSPSNFTGRMAEADRYDPAEFEESRENRRRGRLRTASFEALMRRSDPAMNRQRAQVEDIEDQQAEDYDLEYKSPRRAALAGGIKRDEAMRDAGAEQARYFEQEPMRESKERSSFEALRRRYTDPAMIRADADLARERMRGDSARGVAEITGGSRERTAAVNQFGRVTGDQALTGDRAAASAGSRELQGRMGPATKTMPMSGPRGLQAFAQSKGMTIDEAIEYAEARGYTITD